MRGFLVSCGILCLFLASAPIQSQSNLDADVQFLKSLGMDTEPAKLLDFFRARTPRAGDKEALQKLVAQMDSTDFAARDVAAKELLARGPLALPYLRAAIKKDTPLELVRRLEDSLKKIEKTLNPEQTVAAARVLAERRTPEALQVLLDYQPQADDAWLEEEILGSIGALAVRDGKVDPALEKTLKNPDAGRRAAAAYVLAQRADIAQRDGLRQLLADPDPKVVERVVLGLLGKRHFQVVRDMVAGDEALLKINNVGSDEPALLEFLRRRTLSEEDQQRLKNLIRQLGDSSFQARNQASKELIKKSTSALAFLKAAVDDPDPEIGRRVRLCIEEINRGPGSALPAAAIRLLGRFAQAKDHAPAAAIRVVLGYVPFADDETVEEEALNTLCLLSVREVKIDPLLPLALGDALAARRAAAAFVLGKVGTREHQPGLRKLLEDPALNVRLRTAQGLLAAKDKDAVPVLIQLLADLPGHILWQVEEQLYRLAGEKGPTEAVGDGTGGQRAKAVKAWTQWWQAQASTIDLARVAEGDYHLGLMTICEYDSAVGQPGGQVWETGREGKPRWKIKGVMGAMDAQVLPSGRVLVAENSAQRVTERDLNGEIKWQFQVPGNPIACQRLPNGNTFIATYNNLMEISPDQKIVYNHNRGPQFYIFSARKTRAGLIVCMSAQGNIMEIDALTGKEIRSLNLGPNGGWCSAESLPNGRFLVATMNTGQVREVDASGKTHWSATYQGVFRATRMPNGNTLVASMTTRKVAEFDRAGVMRWEKTCEGRPWSIRYR